MAGISRRSQFGIMVLGIVFYELWEIWKIWCKVLFEDIAIPPEHVIRSIYSHLHTLNAIIVPKRLPTKWETRVLEIVRILAFNIVLWKLTRVLFIIWFDTKELSNGDTLAFFEISGRHLIRIGQLSSSSGNKMWWQLV